MALLVTPLNGDILVVGDGNFSFSCCLAVTLSNTDCQHKIVATCFDKRAELEKDGFAQENIKKLSPFSNVEIIYGVDATNLDSTFKSRKFARIIFNFPHTGGKSNIKKCRQLLVDFFADAAGHVLPKTGEVCVSLCQGQGGIPADQVQRGYGNTWQVVEQAAKANLMLKAVFPFTSSEYPQYRSAGYRGLLQKGFHTRGGLTYIFIHGAPLKPISEFGEAAVAATTTSHHQFPTHPINALREKLREFFQVVSVKCDLRVKFEISCPLEAEEKKVVKSLDTQMTSVDKANTEFVKANEFPQCNNSRLTKPCITLSAILKGLEINTKSFIVSGSNSNFSLPVSKHYYPMTEHMVIVRRDVCIAKEKLLSELNDVVSMFVKEFFPNIHVCQKKNPANGQEMIILSNEFLHNNILNEDFKTESNCGRGSSQGECLPKTAESFCFHAGKSHSTNTRVHGGNFPLSDKCELCRQEVNFSYEKNQEKSKWIASCLLETLSCKCVVFKDMKLLTCGLMKELTTTDCSTMYAPSWIIEIDLDAVLMALFDLPDARLLHSCEPKFLDQFINYQEAKNTFHFEPFSLYPPSYTHDISFWLEAGTTEIQFLETIYQLTQNCVQSVIFKERYYDRGMRKVSYNYRMIYSRCDGPLSHLQSVKMQNLLRRNLMMLGFGLK